MGDMGDESDDEKQDGPIALCASCDRCRARKTKCDGTRPCGNCATKYMKKNKLTRYGMQWIVERSSLPL
jgi:hypothetical protein